MTKRFLRIYQVSFCIILIPVFQSLPARDFTVKTLTTKDGLSHNNVRSIVRDSTGFLWIGTWDGLCRYDGHEFKNYYHVPNDTSSLPYFSILKLIVDRNNDLWIYSEMGLLCRYQRNSDNFSIVRKIAGTEINYVNSIETDNEGNPIIWTRDAIIRWNRKSGSIIRYSLVDKTGKQPQVLNSYSRSTIYFHEDELWLIGPSSGLRFLKSSENIYKLDKEYSLINPSRNKLYFDYHPWFRMYISAKGQKWIFSCQGLFKFDEKTDSFQEQENVVPAGEFIGNQPFFWGTFYDGIFLYNPVKHELEHIPLSSNEYPLAIFPDGANSLWFSSLTSTGVPMGLKSLVFTPHFFKNYLLSSSDSTEPAVYSVVLDNKKNIWAGVRGFDYIVEISPGDVKKQICKLNPYLYNLTTHIRTMNPVPEGIWIGYYFKMLQFFDYRTNKFINYFPDPVHFRTILPYKDKVYIGSKDILLFDPSSGKTVTVWSSGVVEDIFKMYADTGATIWCAMSKGKIARFNIKTGEGKIITIPPGQSNTEDIIRDHNGDLWLAFLGDGVCRYNDVDGSVKFYTTQNGLSNNTTYNLLEDQSGNIWVSTNNGISLINTRSDQIRTFGLSDGLKIHEFNSGAKFRSSDGEFFFGGMGGFVKFYPDSLTTENITGSKQKIILTNLEVSGIKRLLQKPLNETDTIVLHPGENNFHLTFSTTDFINAEKSRFRYKLSGVNYDWIFTGASNRNINYSNLMPGLHPLLLESNDANGNWIISKQLIIKVLPYYFQTKAFKITAPILAVLLITFLVFIYIKHIRNKEKQKQDALRLQTLQGQMNPHFIFNSLNSINYFISKNDRLSANRYIADFSKLIRSILYNMNNSYITLENEIDSLTAYLKIEYLRFSDRFEYEIITDPGIEPFKYNVSPGLIQPFVENAIWHGVRVLEGRKGKITVRFESRPNEGIVCIIEDDGIGRKRSEEMKSAYSEKKSHGISIAVERLKIINNLMHSDFNLKISDRFPELEETGTKVEIDLPVKKNDNWN